MLRWLDMLDRVLDGGCRLVAALLVLIEIVILFAGVIWRYVLDRPLVWSGELAGMLFLWLVTLGAVIALHQSEHMRMTVVVGRLSPRAQSALKHVSSIFWFP